MEMEQREKWKEETERRVRWESKGNNGVERKRGVEGREKSVNGRGGGWERRRGGRGVKPGGRREEKKICERRREEELEGRERKRGTKDKEEHGSIK